MLKYIIDYEQEMFDSCKEKKENWILSHLILLYRRKILPTSNAY